MVSLMMEAMVMSLRLPLRSLLMLLLLFVPRSLIAMPLRPDEGHSTSYSLLLMLLTLAAYPWPRKNPPRSATFRNCGVITPTQSKFISCFDNAASASQGAAFSPSAICCATTR